MSKTDKPLDLEALLGIWPGAAVPSTGFADRVLVACELAPAPVIPIRPRAARPPSTRRAFFAGAALAAAFLLVPFFVYRTARSSPSVVTAAVTPDLGFERD